MRLKTKRENHDPNNPYLAGFGHAAVYDIAVQMARQGPVNKDRLIREVAAEFEKWGIAASPEGRVQMFLIPAATKYSGLSWEKNADGTLTMKRVK